jgi:hypothetical protein
MVIGAMTIMTAPVFGMPHWVNDKSQSRKNGAGETTGHSAGEFNDRDSADISAPEISYEIHDSSQLLSLLRGASGVIDGFATVVTALTRTDPGIETERGANERANAVSSHARLRLVDEDLAWLERLKGKTGDYWGGLGGLVVVGIGIGVIPS